MTTSPEPEYPEDYYEHIAHTLGEEQAAWARLPRAEREAELRWMHENFNTPDDLAVWPPELNGGLENGWRSSSPWTGGPSSLPSTTRS